MSYESNTELYEKFRGCDPSVRRAAFLKAHPPEPEEETEEEPEPKKEEWDIFRSRWAEFRNPANPLHWPEWD